MVLAGTSWVVSLPTTDAPSVLDLSEAEQLRLALRASVEETAGPSTSCRSSKNLGAGSSSRHPHGNKSCGVLSTITTLDTDDDDCVVVLDSDGEDSEVASRGTPIAPPLRELPTVTDPSTAFRIALRLPCGRRTVLTLDSSLRLETLFSYLESLGYPSADFELLRVHPRLCLNNLPNSTRIDETGLAKADVDFSVGEAMSSPATQGFIKTVMVMMESVVSGHRMVAFRPRHMTTRKEMIAFDPLVQQDVLYRELKKIRSLRKAGSRD
ncbi:unnamed protein product [Mesocestoides corti]|uniref:UBX domain-containing protein n=2 Tax=Mesocestoides corti TaxID=53468 RepID=A0A0R3U8C2_MESCO|nr:unnamed protein product [Mesocestoides corti]